MKGGREKRKKILNWRGCQRRRKIQEISQPVKICQDERSIHNYLVTMGGRKKKLKEKVKNKNKCNKLEHKKVIKKSNTKKTKTRTIKTKHKQTRQV